MRTDKQKLFEAITGRHKMIIDSADLIKQIGEQLQAYENDLVINEKAAKEGYLK